MVLDLWEKCGKIDAHIGHLFHVTHAREISIKQQRLFLVVYSKQIVNVNFSDIHAFLIINLNTVLALKPA